MFVDAQGLLENPMPTNLTVKQKKITIVLLNHDRPILPLGEAKLYLRAKPLWDLLLHPQPKTTQLEMIVLGGIPSDSI